MKTNLLSWVPLLLIIVCSLLSILPLFHGGFFPMHDNTQVQRVYEMHKSLADGMLPVRWVSDLGYGYGYPLFTFYGPLAYYIGGLLNFLVDSLVATKIMIGIGMMGSGVTMYFLGKTLWGKTGGIISAFLYIFAPYHAVDLYVRGDIGELWAYLFVPLVFWGFYEVYRTTSASTPVRNKIFNFQFSIFKWVIVGGVGLAGLILSHNLSAFMIVPFLSVFILFLILISKNKFYMLLLLLFTFIFALGLSAFYWLPVFGEMRYTNVLSQVGGGANFRDHFVCLNQLWQSQWGFGGSTKGCLDGLSFMIGKIHILLSLGALLLSPFLWRQRKIAFAGVLCLVGLILSIFLMLPVSEGLWQSIPQMAFLQYPWRYLLLASFFSSLLGGIVVEFAIQKQRMIGWILTFCLIVGLFFLHLKYFQPQSYTSDTSGSLTSIQMLSWTTSKISDEYMPKGFQKPSHPEDIPSLLVIPSSGLSVSNEKTTTQKKEVTLSLTKTTSIPLVLAYFPAWQATDNGMPVALQASTKGVRITLGPGLHRLTLTYVSTFIESLGNSISLTSIAILILGIIWEIGKLYEHKSP